MIRHRWKSAGVEVVPPHEHWLALRAWGSSRVVKSSYFWLLFVPVAAKAIGPLGDEHTFALFGSEFQLSLSLPFSWKILYLSGVAFALAHILYLVYCPPLIRLYRNFARYRAETGPGTYALVQEISSIVRVHNFRRVISTAKLPLSQHIAPLLSALPLSRDEKSQLDEAIKHYDGEAPPDTAAERLQDDSEEECKRQVTEVLPNAKHFWVDAMLGRCARERLDYERTIASVFAALVEILDRQQRGAQRLVALLFGVGAVLLAVVMVQNFIYVAGLLV